MLIRPAISRRLENRNCGAPWWPVNAVAMTVFIWHMTALLVVIAAVNALGLGLPAHPTTAWWLQRPLWLALPAAVLGGLTVLFSRIERAAPVAPGLDPRGRSRLVEAGAEQSPGRQT